MTEITSAVEFKDFTFVYGQLDTISINQISFSVLPGQIVFLGGASGSGKSTISNAISGQIPFKITGKMKGEVLLFGKDIRQYKVEELPLIVGMVFQNAEEQLVNFTVYDELAFVAENLCLPKVEIKEKIHNIAQKFGLENLLDRSIHNLSGGEKQRVILAANLMHTPKILIFDEPLAFLDLNAERNFIQIINTLHHDYPFLTIFIIEHRLSPFRGIVDKLIILEKTGTMKFQGNLAEYDVFRKTQSVPILREEIRYDTYSNFLSQTQNIPMLPSSQPIINVQNLSFGYPNLPNIFENVNLTINAGEYIGIVGENGSGKSTLLYILANLLRPQTGTLSFRSQAYESFIGDELYSKFGFIFQNPENQIFENTIVDEILFGAKNFDANFEQNKPQYLDEIKTVLLPLMAEKRTDLITFQNQNPFRLSWGQKRRLNIASILIYHPNLIFLDEPFIGQDAESVGLLMKILQDAHQKGTTIILVSHDLELLQKNCSRVIFMDDLKKTIANQNSPTTQDQKDQKIISLSKPISKKQSRMNYLVENTLKNRINPGPISQINPVVKILGIILFSFLLFIQVSILSIVFCFGLIVVGSFLAKIPLKEFIFQARFIIILTAVYIPLNTIFDAIVRPNDEILFLLIPPYFPVRRLTCYWAVRTGVIILILFSSSIIFTRTTNLKDLVYSLIQIGIPYRYAFAFMIGLRYIPIIQNELSVIEMAQKLRGYGIRKKSKVKKVFMHLIHRLTILLIAIFRKANTTAMAVEIRGFGIYSKRTNLHHVKWNFGDLIWMFLFIGLFIFGIAYANYFFPIIQLPSLYSLWKVYFAPIFGL